MRVYARHFPDIKSAVQFATFMGIDYDALCDDGVAADDALLRDHSLSSVAVINALDENGVSLIVTRSHLILDEHGRHYCSRGVRPYLKRHGLSWSEFVRCGIDARTILRIDDTISRRVVRIALMENDDGQ